MGTPDESSIRKVSRALCPVASTRAEHFSMYSTPPETIRAAMTAPLSSRTRPVSFVEKRISPPREIISLRMLFTTRVSTSVPTWGFASYVTERGAP